MTGLFTKGLFSSRRSGSAPRDVDVNVPRPQAQSIIKEETAEEQEAPADPPQCETTTPETEAYPHGFRLRDFESLEHALTVLGQLEPSERGTSWLINDVAEALREQGRRQEARALFAEALDARRAALGNDDPGTLTSLNNLGLLLREMGELAGAKALLEEAVAARRKAQGDAHPETLTAINNLGALLKAQGALPDAQALYEEALATRRDALGAEHPDTLTSMNNLASLYRAQGNLTNAEVLLYEAAMTSHRVLGQEHPHTRIITRNLKGVRQAVNPNAIFSQPTAPATYRKVHVQPGRRRPASGGNTHRAGGATVR